MCDSQALPGQANNCGQDPYIVLADRADCVDQQARWGWGAAHGPGRETAGGNYVDSTAAVAAAAAPDGSPCDSRRGLAGGAC